ncbi:hypothetical protein M422DRAFT_249433 [Sphaerobolus stellatus SS14]|uniref:Uncharacterized protein n=1 Tax=Sphaerobolus stellatus (strain SS14) TaxID=990650 RepID=A0A0C9W4H0_SPHS4|nr:hypothetical protein M422DRAFT_249433 [Sphaerobolus stellatus SS14]
MGDIKTKKWNHMAPQKTRDTAFLKLEIQCQHAIDGVVHKRVKHQYGQESIPTGQDKSASRIDDEEVTDGKSEIPSEDESSIEDGDSDDENAWDVGIEGDNLVRGLEPVRKIRFFFGKKRLFTISELFNWDKKSGWDEFWRWGKKRVGEELQFYELLTRANLEDRSEAINASET